MESENQLMEIVVGTYEKYILGFILEVEDEKFILKPSFTNEAHLQSVRCLASSSKFLASGSGDEIIRLFNMKTRQEVGSLQHHNGTITHLEFYDSFLISSSEDTSICIWSTTNWLCLKTLSSHKKAVNSVSIHPSGKMALSVSKDNFLRTWNLINGRSAFKQNIRKVAETVKWSPDGSHFLVSFLKSIDVYSTQNAQIITTISTEYKICDFTFIRNDQVAIGGEFKVIQVYDIKSGDPVAQIETQSNRIKALHCILVNEESFIVSASSDGRIRVWHLDLTKDKLKSKKIAKIDTGSRLTCMTVMAKS